MTASPSRSNPNPTPTPPPRRQFAASVLETRLNDVLRFTLGRTYGVSVQDSFLSAPPMVAADQPLPGTVMVRSCLCAWQTHRGESSRSRGRFGPSVSDVLIGRAPRVSDVDLSVGMVIVRVHLFRTSAHTSWSGCAKTRATMEVHHFFSNTTPQFGRNFRPLPKTALFGEKNKTAATTPAKNSHDLGMQREPCKKIRPTYYFIFFPRLWVKDRRHSETIVSDEKC